MIVAYIDGERVAFDPDSQIFGEEIPMIETEDGREFYIAESSEDAGDAARDYWEEMANDDPKEFICVVGEETLVQWGLGNYAGPGSTQVQSLSEWLDLWSDCPEDHFASYDQCECEFKCKHPDYSNYTVAYRHN